MLKVKGRLVQQKQKIQAFEDKRQRMENKKFHRAIKAYKQTEKHKEKRQNVEQINSLKKRITEQGGDINEKDFNKIFNGGQKDRGNTGRRKSVIDRVKEAGSKKQTRKERKASYVAGAKSHGSGEEKPAYNGGKSGKSKGIKKGGKKSGGKFGKKGKGGGRR